MNDMPMKLRKQLAADPYYRICARASMHKHTCSGRITWEHALINAGKQVQKRFAIIPLCEKAHNCGKWQDRGDMDKEINVWIALNRATDAELVELSKAEDQFRKKAFLNKKYGPYAVDLFKTEQPGIQYPWLRNSHSVV